MDYKPPVPEPPGHGFENDLHRYMAMKRWRDPRHVPYSTYSERLRSFSRWPRNLTLSMTERLAAAGFFLQDGKTHSYYSRTTVNKKTKSLSYTQNFSLQSKQIDAPVSCVE